MGGARRRARVVRGPAVRRFHGGWTLTFGGSTAGECLDLNVDTAGTVTGSCRVLLNGQWSDPFISVTGSISATGSATLTTSTGATMTGSFNTPFHGTGTWTNGSATGNWTAGHL
jgi:hypothetical protein